MYNLAGRNMNIHLHELPHNEMRGQNPRKFTQVGEGDEKTWGGGICIKSERIKPMLNCGLVLVE